MQKVKIPHKVDPVRAAAKKFDYDGYIPRDKLERLAGVVETVLSDAEVRLSFSVDLQGLTVIEGSAGAAVKCECQRCGNPCELGLSADFHYTADEKKARDLGLEDDYDFADPDEFGELDIYNLVEDELILSLPMVIMHPEGECEMPEGGVYGKIVTENTESNPFAVLGKLKKS